MKELKRIANIQIEWSVKKFRKCLIILERISILLINFKFEIILHASKELGGNIKLFLKKLDSISDKINMVRQVRLVLFILFPI